MEIIIGQTYKKKSNGVEVIVLNITNFNEVVFHEKENPAIRYMDADMFNILFEIEDVVSKNYYEIRVDIISNPMNEPIVIDGFYTKEEILNKIKNVL